MSKLRNISFLTILTLLVAQIGASAFTPYQVENKSKVLLYWGDIAQNISTGSSTSFDGSIEGKEGRVLALQSIAFESSDEITHKDSRAKGQVEFKSNITAGVDGMLLLVSENESELEIELDTLGTHTINMRNLKSTDFTYNSGNFGLKARYLGKDFLSTPQSPGGTSSFSDVPTSEWFFKYTQRIKDRTVENQPIFEGYKTASGNLTGRFGPADDITLAEMLKVVLRVSGHNENTSNLDASLQGSTHWSVGFQNTAIDLDLTIMQAVGINPDRPVIRGEFFQALAEAQGLMSSSNYNCNITDLDFEDLDSSNPYTKYACILVKDGIISGTDQGYLNLNNKINRAEVAKILNTALDTYVEQPTNVNNEIEVVIDLESNSNGGGTTDTSFVLTSTLDNSEIGYTKQLKVNFTEPNKVRPSDIELKLYQDGNEVTSSINSQSYSNGTLSINLINQWPVGKYTIFVKDTDLDETKEHNFEVLNCGEQTNPCPATGHFLRDSELKDELIGYPEAAVVLVEPKDNYRKTDLDIMLEKDGQNITNTLSSTTYDESTGELNFRQTTQWNPGYYTLTLTDLALNDSKEFEFEVMNCGEQTDPCPATGSFVKDSDLVATTIGYSKPLQIDFFSPEKVRESDLEYTLTFEGNDVSNDIGTTSYSNGRLEIRRTAQWASGSYIINIKDAPLNETATFNFTVSNNP
jgi:hypothetical protein